MNDATRSSLSDNSLSDQYQKYALIDGTFKENHIPHHTTGCTPTFLSDPRCRVRPTFFYLGREVRYRTQNRINPNFSQVRAHPILALDQLRNHQSPSYKRYSHDGYLVDIVHSYPPYILPGSHRPSRFSVSTTTSHATYHVSCRPTNSQHKASHVLSRRRGIVLRLQHSAFLHLKLQEAFERFPILIFWKHTRSSVWQ